MSPTPSIHSPTKDTRFLREIAERHPIAFCLLIVPVISGILLPFRLLREIAASYFPIFVGQIFGVTLVSVLVILSLKLLGWRREVGFNQPNQWRNFCLFWFAIPLLLPGSLAILVGRTKVSSLLLIIFYAWLAILVGFNEESLFRGVMLRTMQRYGYFAAALFSAFLFSLAHVFNLMVGFRIDFVLIQIYVAFCLGVLLAALRIRTGTIWGVIAFHTLLDFLGFIVNDPLNWTGTGGIPKLPLSSMPFALGYLTIFLALGIWLLRPKRSAAKLD